MNQKQRASKIKDLIEVGDKLNSVRLGERTVTRKTNFNCYLDSDRTSFNTIEWCLRNQTITFNDQAKQSIVIDLYRGAKTQKTPKPIIWIIVIFSLLMAACSSSESEEPQPVQPKETISKVTPIDSAFSHEVYIEGEATEHTRFDVGAFVEWHKYYVARFYREAKEYGWGDLPKNNLLVATHFTDTPQPCRSYVNSSGQLIIQINSHLSIDQAFIPFYRELAHNLLGKPYGTNADDMMAPGFNKSFTARNFDEKVARPYLDKLFKK